MGWHWVTLGYKETSPKGSSFLHLPTPSNKTQFSFLLRTSLQCCFFFFLFLFISILFFAPHVVPGTLPHPNPNCVSDRAGQQPPHQMIDYFPQNKKNCKNGATRRRIVKYCSFEWFLG